MGVVDANMAQRACLTRQRAREMSTTLAVLNVGEAESHCPAPCMVHQFGRHNRVVVGVAGSV